MIATVTPFGDVALLVDLEDVGAAHRLAAALEADRVHGRAPAGFEESVVGFGNVVVHVDPSQESSEAAEAWVRRVAERVADSRAGSDGDGGDGTGRRTRLELPVGFDGPDLDEVAAGLGTTTGAVVEALCGVDLSVAFLGFSTGFPYLLGLPPALASVSRRPTPRPSVPAGSVAVAGGFASVYPTATPGGWRLLGRTSVPLFDPARPPYARLRPGDTVRFRPGDAGGLAPGDESARAAWTHPPGAAFAEVAEIAEVAEVAEPGLLSLIQDGGRRSSGGLGVPRAGPADPEAMRLANRLMGDPDDTAVIEVTAAGPTLRMVSAAHLAVVGSGGDPGAVELRVDGRPVASSAVIPVAPGQTVAVGRVRRGLRAYLAVSGGLAVPPELGSRSSDVLCGLGPPPLRTGDRLARDHPSRPRGQLLPPPGTRPTGRHRGLRVLPGPHGLAPDRYRRLLSTTWEVGPTSNRIGIRLAPGPDGGEGPPESWPGGPDSSATGDAIPSTGMVTGAVQVPPDDHPIILMPDHATVGGYPVACCVISADLPVLGQLAPGDTVSLTAVDTVTAVRARRQGDRALSERVSGWFPTTAGT